jgi:Na+/pantothenate symporter
MSGMGPFTYALSQTLTSGDYATAFTSVDVLPSAMAGLVIAGVASAIQSTIAAVLVLISSSIVIDAYKDIINPKADSRKLNIMSTLTTIVIGGICMLRGAKPAVMVHFIY